MYDEEDVVLCGVIFRLSDDKAKLVVGVLSTLCYINSVFG
jgi:hypothetical protein